MSGRLPFSAAADGVRLAVRLTPKASAERIIGLADEADGGVVLKVAVTAAPENGKANAALVKLLARAFRLPPRDFSVVRGATDRRKVVAVTGSPTDLTARLTEGLRTWSRA
ncbi:MAG TPA: DUF167 family protein [Stellaceae bacterium]|nr:DUF167 family protein [Stellaceae bacterium]